MPRTDGFVDGFDTIQGVRSYDSTAGSWTTPDMYAGNLEDPSSQKSYLWNGNNPMNNSDPSGYDDEDGGQGGGGESQTSVSTDTRCPPTCFTAATPSPPPPQQGSLPTNLPFHEVNEGTIFVFPVGIVGEGEQAWTLFANWRKYQQIFSRGWNWNLIKEAIEEGDQFPVANRTTTPWTSGTGYMSPTLGRAIMVDNANQTIMQLEGEPSWSYDNNGQLALPGIFPGLLPP